MLRFLGVLAGALASLLYCAGIAHPQDQGPGIVLGSGVRLPGRLVGLNDSTVTVDSSLFLDPVELDRQLVARIDFKPARTAEHDDEAPLGFRLRSGTQLFGRLLNLSDGEVQIATARFGAIRFPRSDVVEIYRLAGSRSLLTASLARWELGTESSRDGKNRNDKKVIWQYDASASLETDVRDAVAFLPVEIPPAGTLDITISAADSPDFVVAFQKNRDIGPNLYYSNGSMMLTGAEGVEFAELQNSKTQTISLQFGWDYANNKIWIADERGNLLVRAASAKPSGETGVCILNQGKDLKIEHLRLSTSPLATAPAEEAKADAETQRRWDVVWLVDGQRKAGTFLSHSADALMFQEAGNSAPISLPVDKVQRVLLATAGQPPAQPSAPGTLIWENGERVAFERARLENGGVVIMAPEIPQSPQIPVTGAESMLIGNIVRETKGAANLQIGTIELPGRWKWGDAQSPVRWQLDGQLRRSRPARLDFARKIVVTQKASSLHKTENQVGDDRIFLACGDVVPGQVIEMTETSVTFSTHFSPQVTLPHNAVRAIELDAASPPRAPAFTKESRQQLLTLPRFSKDLPFTHALLGKNGDLLRGILVSLNDKTIEFDSLSEPMLIPRERVAAIVCFHSLEEDTSANRAPTHVDGIEVANYATATPPIKSPLLQLRLGSNYALSGRFVAKNGDLIELESPVLGRYRVPEAIISSLNANNPDAVADIASYREWSITSAIEPRWETTPAQTPAAAAALEGSIPEDFELTLLDGNTFRLSDHRGKVVVIDFWATWCAPCIRAIPEHLGVLRDLSSQEAVLVGLDQGEPASQVREFLNNHHWRSFPVALDSDGAIARRFNVSGIPHVVVIGPDGAIRHTHVGYSPEAADELREVVDALLGRNK